MTKTLSQIRLTIRNQCDQSSYTEDEISRKHSERYIRDGLSKSICEIASKMMSNTIKYKVEC